MVKKEKNYYKIRVYCTNCKNQSELKIDKGFEIEKQYKSFIFGEDCLIETKKETRYSSKKSFYLICPICESRKLEQSVGTGIQ
jgi:Zn finger protein HypA/HybF involved in hydrogenase expression